MPDMKQEPDGDRYLLTAADGSTGRHMPATGLRR
jgi:hypothetical protein